MDCEVAGFFLPASCRWREVRFFLKEHVRASFPACARGLEVCSRLAAGVDVNDLAPCGGGSVLTGEVCALGKARNDSGPGQVLSWL